MGVEMVHEAAWRLARLVAILFGVTYFARSNEDDPSLPDQNDIRVEIVERCGDVERVVGGYRRNYSTMFHTFAPFRRNGKDFALYSPQYTCTRVMSLPDCADIGGEEPDSGGFCPTDYLVPDESVVGDLAGRFGLMHGCHWACPYQIQFLDLTRAEEGVIVRSDLLTPSIDLPNRPGVRIADMLEVLRNNAGGLGMRLRVDLQFHLAAMDERVEVRGF